MSKITNKDIFFEFLSFIRNGASDEEVTREYGGGQVYIPSFKNTFRNNLIIQDYKDGKNIRKIASEYQLSTNGVYDILREHRKKST